MRELFWSVFGSLVVGGGICIAADSMWDKHWNFWLISGIVFAVYWILRLGFGDDVLDISFD
ncbi:hypothetical protein SEA_KENREY_225 [Streptomyces phage Kenrey]|nr:hypothetical protein SEA_KENREY_225 [Streptomyces phage Kenrey]